MADPIHQFVIEPIVPLQVAGVDISYTNSSLWMTIAVIASIAFLTLAMRKKAMIPGRLQVISEMTYSFIANMIRENIGPRGMEYFPLVFTIFMMVFVGNMLGMIPWSFTYTSHLVVTAALAFMIFFMVLIIGLVRHGSHFFHLFLPPGVPVWLFPLIIPIEIVSFVARPITLSVRLFANMIAGHIVLLALLSLIFIFKSIFVAPISIAAAVGIASILVGVAVAMLPVARRRVRL